MVPETGGFPDSVSRIATYSGLVTNTNLTEVDRRRAAEWLREHMLLGRLDEAQYRSRLAMLPGLRTTSELGTVFYDLPQPRPTASSQWAQPPFAPAPPISQPTNTYQSAPFGNPGFAEPEESVAYVAGPVVSGPGTTMAPTGRPSPLDRIQPSQWRALLRLTWPLAVVLWIASGSFYWILLPLILGPILRTQYVKARRREQLNPNYRPF
ncbi:MAG TPA: hypothetical protein DEH05_00090 [Propionibacteriaceae bacterium]|nr:hypothetical protein [Propionibacteriaceae bacterium]